MKWWRALLIILSFVILVGGLSCGKGAITPSASTIPPSIDTAPPVIANVSATDMTETTAIITWTTDEPATSRVEWMPAPGSCNGPLWTLTREESQLVTSHSITLTQAGLGPGSTYVYWVQSKDANGNEAKSEDRTFTTLGTAEVPDFPVF
jgi:hypothetical protein